MSKSKTKETVNMKEIEKEVSFHREAHEDYETWNSGMKARTIVEFSKPLLDLGFSHDAIATFWANEQSVQLSIDLKQMEIEIERIRAKLPEGECECEECSAKRGDSEL